MNDVSYLTPEGAARLRDELAYLKGPGREELAQRLRTAISQGDLSENADYIKAKEDQGFLEGQILELEQILRNVVILEQTHGKQEEVTVGTHVTIQEEGLDPETYYLVGPKEADPRNGRISHESPIGRVLIGHHVGETVTAETPNGSLSFTILKIE
jgi:transcription elongation factor GreA